MSNNRNRRRRFARRATTAICEKFEDRLLLTQLVPIADLTNRGPQLIGETSEAVILQTHVASNETDVLIFDKASGTLSAPQRLPVPQVSLASSDGKTLLSSISMHAPSTGEYIGREFVFFRQSVSTGLYEESARYHFSAVDYRYVETAFVIGSDGAYATTSDSSSNYSLLFLPSVQAAAPTEVFAASVHYISLVNIGSDVFARGSSVGLQQLPPDGGTPQGISGSNDIPVAVAGGKVFVSRYSGTVSRLVSIDPSAGLESSLAIGDRKSVV